MNVVVCGYNKLTIRPPNGERVLLFNKNNLSSEDAKICKNVLIFGITNSETCQMIKSFLHEKFWEVSVQTTACERDDHCFALRLILGEKLGICGRDDLFSILFFT